MCHIYAKYLLRCIVPMVSGANQYICFIACERLLMLVSYASACSCCVNTVTVSESSVL